MRRLLSGGNTAPVSLYQGKISITHARLTFAKEAYELIARFAPRGEKG